MSGNEPTIIAWLAADPQFADKNGNLVIHDKADCLEKNESTTVLLGIPATAVTNDHRSIKATVLVENHGDVIAETKTFDVHFPKPGNAAAFVPKAVASPEPTSTVLSMPNGQTTVSAEGTISVTSEPKGADIFVDSAGQGHSPARVNVKPGKHSVQLALSGYKDFSSEVTVEAGSNVNVTTNLEK